MCFLAVDYLLAECIAGFGVGEETYASAHVFAKRKLYRQVVESSGELVARFVALLEVDAFQVDAHVKQECQGVDCSV